MWACTPSNPAKRGTEAGWAHGDCQESGNLLFGTKLKKKKKKRKANAESTCRTQLSIGLPRVAMTLEVQKQRKAEFDASC